MVHHSEIHVFSIRRAHIFIIVFLWNAADKARVHFYQDLTQLWHMNIQNQSLLQKLDIRQFGLHREAALFQKECNHFSPGANQAPSVRSGVWRHELC